MKRLIYLYSNRMFNHLIFWLAFFTLYTKLAYNHRPMWDAIIQIYLFKVGVQAIAAYVLVYLLIPAYLAKRKLILFMCLLFVWSYIVFSLLIASRVLYLEPQFLTFFDGSTKHLPYLDESLIHRITDLNAYLDAVPWLFTPAAFMGLIKFYRNQLSLTKIENEKRKLELSVLRNQLNPHFLFNTLNNLYTLTIKKDDKAVKVIEKLSEILDYVLYRCNESKVSINKEVELLDNYIVLEKIRYGESRLMISFTKSIKDNHLVPPLILMTLLENAFKHGVMNEAQQATIIVHLESSPNQLLFSIENTKPNISINPQVNRTGIGLNNIRKQLDLIFANNYLLEENETENTFKVILTIYEV